MSWVDGHLVAFDTETTGKDPLTARIVTVAVVVMCSSAKGHRAEWLVAVDEPLPDEATAVHGITTEYAQEHGQQFTEVMAAVRAALSTAWMPAAPLIAMNAPYDLTVLTCELQRCGLPPLEPDSLMRPVVDPLVCDRGFDRYRPGSRKLAALCEHYGVKLDDAHNSTADALAAARVVWKMARTYPEMAEMTLPSLYQAQQEWHAEWAASYQRYLRTRTVDPEPDAVIDGSWPMWTASGQSMDSVREKVVMSGPSPSPNPRHGGVRGSGAR